MMDDVYLEYLIKRKTDGRQKAIIVAVIAAGIVVSGILFYLILALAYAAAGTPIGSFIFSIGLVLIAFAWYGVYLVINMQKLEFEYILTNSSLDIDKVLAKKGRKPFVSFDFKNIIICARTDDDGHNHDYKSITPDKLYDAVGNKENGGIYFVDYMNENTRNRVIFQPTGRMISAAHRYNPRNIFIKE